MKFAVLFEDNPDANTDLRSKHMPDHLSFLEKHSTTINSAGPLLDENGSGAGGLWIVDSDSEATVRGLVEEDPFWPTGLRQSVRILTWRQVFADGLRLL